MKNKITSLDFLWLFMHKDSIIQIEFNFSFNFSFYYLLSQIIGKIKNFTKRLSNKIIDLLKRIFNLQFFIKL